MGYTSINNCRNKSDVPAWDYVMGGPAVCAGRFNQHIFLHTIEAQLRFGLTLFHTKEHAGIGDYKANLTPMLTESHPCAADTGRPKTVSMLALIVKRRLSVTKWTPIHKIKSQ